MVASMNRLILRGTATAFAFVCAGMLHPAWAEPSLSGTLLDAEDDNRFFTRTGGTARDDLAYAGLTSGQTYTLSAQLIDVATGEPSGETVFTSFTAEAAEGTVSVSLPVPANRTAYNIDYASHVTLYEGEVDAAGAEGAAVLAEIAEHQGTERVIQVHAVQRVRVTAADAADGDRALPPEGGTIVATVEYENLVEGYKYTLWGELLKASGQSTAIFASIPELVPETKNGSVTMEFAVPEGLEGLQLVPSIGLYHQARVELQPGGRLTILPDAANPVMIASDPNLNIPEKLVDIGEPFVIEE